MTYQYGASLNTDKLRARIRELESRLEEARRENARKNAALAAARSTLKRSQQANLEWSQKFDDPRFLALVHVYRERNKSRYTDTPEICRQRLNDAVDDMANWTDWRYRKTTA